MARIVQAPPISVTGKAERPRARAADRLHQALEDLARGGAGRVSVAELSRRADVSRNSIYRYHGEVLQRLKGIPKLSSRAEHEKQETVSNLRSENAMLRKQLTQVASLVDHFYAAYQETQLLLQRREREIADVRRTRNTKPRLVR